MVTSTRTSPLFSLLVLNRDKLLPYNYASNPFNTSYSIPLCFVDILTFLTSGDFFCIVYTQYWISEFTTWLWIIVTLLATRLVLSNVRKSASLVKGNLVFWLYCRWVKVYAPIEVALCLRTQQTSEKRNRYITQCPQASVSPVFLEDSWYSEASALGTKTSYLLTYTSERDQMFQYTSWQSSW